MATVATGVEASRLLALNQATSDAAVNDGASTDMIQSLETMAGSFEGLRSLDLSFSWAPAEEAVPPAVEVVQVDRDMVERLPRARKDLAQQPVKPSIETIYGQVTRLERGTDDSEGNVTVRGIIGDTTQRQLRVALAGSDYDRAIRAHRSRRPISVKGVLERRGRDNWLTGPVKFSDKL